MLQLDSKKFVKSKDRILTMCYTYIYIYIFIQIFLIMNEIIEMNQMIE